MKVALNRFIKMLYSFAVLRCIPRRYIIVFLGFLSFAILNAQRINLTFALNAMTNPCAMMTFNRTAPNCTRNSQANVTDIYTKQRVFNWNSTTQGYIMSLSFVGFVLTQIPGGRFAQTLGAKQMLCFGILCASSFNVFAPLAADWSVYMFTATQIGKGLAQGVLQPAVSCLMAHWYPKEERSLLSSITYSGFPVGALIGGIVSGILCNSTIFGGWPAVFYVFGLIGLFLALIGTFLIYNTPEEYEASNRFKLQITSDKLPQNKKKLKTPWLKMVFSVPSMALLAGMIGQYWMTFYFISVHPIYLSDVLNLHITDNGMYSSLPYILQILVTWVGSSLSDWLTQKGYASTDTVRKWCNTLSCLGFCMSMVGVVYAEYGIYLNIVCFFIAMASIGLGYPGSLTVPMDMTKNYAGVLVGLFGTLSSTSGFIIPLMVGYITENKGTLLEWHIVIYSSVAVVMTSGLVFHWFGSTELQDWDAQTEDLKTDSDNINEDKQCYI